MSRSAGRPWIRLALLAVLVLGALAAARFTPLGDLLSREGIRQGVETLRGSPWAPVIFVGLYAGATAVAIPGTVLTLAGGALFGVVWGTFYNWLAANLGANAAFGIARWLGRDAVERVTGDRLGRLDRATRDHGFRGLLALRLLPVVPFNALNFGSGLTAISWRSYALATALGILPGTFVYTLFADALLAGSTEASREAFLQVAVAGALLVVLSFLPTLLKKMGVTLPGRSAALLLCASLGTVTPGCSDAPDPTAEEVPAAAASTVQAAPGDTLPSHRTFTRLLGAVVEEPRVDYGALVERNAELDSYLARLAAADPAALEAADRATRLAFWINAYNACMLDLVAEHYPIEAGEGGLLQRIENVVADRPANSVWQIEDVFTRPHCRVAGAARSQDEIEHEIIRPMGDPRIHFAVNCAARSCPSLVDEAYVAGRLDEQLDAAVRRFVADPRHFRLEREDGRDVLLLNRVLEWYAEDFGGVEGLPGFFADYLEGERRRRVLDPSTEVRFLDYDWTLNDTAARG